MIDPAARHGHARLDFIQALRGLAAFSVVLYHGRMMLGGAGDQLFGWGAAGVDLFFVISGFIMVYTTAGSDGSVRYAAEFLTKRLARIWPVYAVWTVFYVWLVERIPHLGRALVRSSLFYPVSTQGPPWFGGAPNSTGWSLNYEVWFYVVFAASLLARRWRWQVLALLLFGFGIAIPLAVTGAVHTSAYANYRLPTALLRLAANPMMWDFAAGVAIGLVYRSRLRFDRTLVLAPLVALVVVAEVWQLGSHYRAGYGFFAWGGMLALTVFALAMWNKHRPIAVPRVLVWLGDISFSLYLIHRIPLLALLRWSGIGGVPYLIGTTAISLVLADLSARYLERGLAEWVRDRLLNRVRAVLRYR